VLDVKLDRWRSNTEVYHNERLRPNPTEGVRPCSVVVPQVTCIGHGLHPDVPPARREGLLRDRVKLVLLRERSVRQEVTKIDNLGVIMRLLFAGRNGQDGSGDYLSPCYSGHVLLLKPSRGAVRD
jgi:hypothetical protein